LRALLGDVASGATTKIAGETDILVIPRAVAHHGGAGVEAVTECVSRPTEVLVRTLRAKKRGLRI